MTMLQRAGLALSLLLAMAQPLAAVEPCFGPPNVEEFHYSWRLRGGLRMIAGFIFPTSGLGSLKTTYPVEGKSGTSSELLITAPEGASGGYYAYESTMDDAGSRTEMTYHGYSWGEKMRKERTNFDYGKRLARIHKETPKGAEYRVKKMPDGEANLRDVLTAIHFLRQNAPRMTGPIVTSIFSDGKDYPVMFRPGERRSFVIEGKNLATRAFDITDAPGGKKWPGGVSVWITDDERRIPVRIVIQQSLASLQLDVRTIKGCASIHAPHG